MKTRILLSVLFILLLAGCKESNKKEPLKLSDEELNQIYEEKGINMRSLKPQVIPLNESISGIFEINREGCLATVYKGKFAILSIDEYGITEVNIINESFPPEGGTNRRTDPINNVMWQKEGTIGFSLFDIESKKGASDMAGGGYLNADIYRIFLADPEKKIFSISYADVGSKPSRGFYVLYDLENNKKIYLSNNVNGELYSLEKDKYLYMEYTGGQSVHWYITDLYLKEKKENKLTKELTKFNIDVDFFVYTNNNYQRKILGTSEVKGMFANFFIRWDEEFEEVHVEPLLLQCPREKRIYPDFISGSGKWMKGIQKAKTGLEDVPRIVLFHCSDMYPQGVSMPIECGYSLEGTPGAFMNHKEWGECYVEYDNGKLFVYKCSEALAWLAKQTEGITGGKEDDGNP